MSGCHPFNAYFLFISFFFCWSTLCWKCGGRGHGVVSAAAAHLLIGDHLWTSWCFLSAFPALLPFEPFPFSSASSVLLSSLFRSSLYPPISPSFIRRRKKYTKKWFGRDTILCIFSASPHPHLSLHGLCILRLNIRPNFYLLRAIFYLRARAPQHIA